MKNNVFLSAEWRKLIIANYVVDPICLKKFVPADTELDLWNGRCYVSLVGFMFLDTKVLGVRIPYHVDFEEVNLRFYVRRNDQGEWKRGVVFIKEIVPKTAITEVANYLYREKYETRQMDHDWKVDDRLEISYSWRKQGLHRISCVAETNFRRIEIGSEEEFITEHYWGYTKISAARTAEYQVAHPRWDVYPVKSYEIKVNFENVYGNSFSFLDSLTPVSVFLAEGSEIQVMKGKRI